MLTEQERNALRADLKLTVELAKQTPIPPKSILDKSFVYVPSHKTNVRETLDRIRAKQKEEAAQKLRNVIQRRFSKNG